MLNEYIYSIVFVQLTVSKMPLLRLSLRRSVMLSNGILIF